jgi:hypothetical protein
MTLRWVKDIATKQYHLLGRTCVQVQGHRAWHSTKCGKVVEGRVFRDGFPPGADCVPCLQLAQIAKAAV